MNKEVKLDFLQYESLSTGSGSDDINRHAVSDLADVTWRVFECERFKGDETVKIGARHFTVSRGFGTFLYIKKKNRKNNSATYTQEKHI